MMVQVHFSETSQALTVIEKEEKDLEDTLSKIYNNSN